MRTFTKKARLLTAIRRQESDSVPVAPFTWHLLRKWYGDVGPDLEVKAGRVYDFDPMPHLGMYEGAPFHNNIRLLNGSYVLEGRAYAEDMAAGVTIDLRIERLPDATIVTRTIHTPAGPLRDALRQPTNDWDFRPDSPRPSGWGRPQRLEWLLKEPADLEKLRFLLTMPTTGQLGRIRRWTEQVGEDGLLAGDCLSPIDYQANEAMPLEQLQALYDTDRPFFDAVIGLFWEHTERLTRAYLQNGLEMVNGVWYGCGPSDGWPVEIFREVFLPLLKRHVALTHEYGAIYEYNEEGRERALLPLLVEAGVDVVKTLTPPPDGDVDLAEVKREFGAKLCLRGYIDSIRVLQEGTPASIAEAVRDAILTAGPGGGFIIGTTRPITVFTPEENVRAYFEACRRYGNYSHLGRA